MAFYKRFIQDALASWRMALGVGCVSLLAPSAALAQTPITLQAEDFTAMSGVQVELTADTGGGKNVGWIDARDWMSYTVNVPVPGWYTVDFRVAALAGTGSLVLSKNATDISPLVTIPATGGWQNWVNVSARVQLTAGVQTLTVYAKSGGFNVNWLRLTPDAVVNRLPAIKQSGQYWVDASGQRVNLRGTNLGNWLIQEYWMTDGLLTYNGGAINDQCTLEATLSQRFGIAEKERLMKAYRDSFITTRDFDMMQAMGLNLIRIPFLYSLIEDEYRPYNLRPDAWQYLDWAINEAEKRGIYVILDLHGAVGGQAGAGEQHDGCIGPAAMWTNANYWDRTNWLWDMIASRYRGRTAVAAYDVLNEPWGTDPVTLAQRVYELTNTIRAKDPDHIVLLPGHNSGIDAYGNPNTKGFTNVATEMHFYPGLWGWNDTASFGAGQANMYANWLHCNPNGTGETCDWRDKIAAIQTPFLIGEFQPWTLLGTYGGQMTRKAYDIFNMYGWAATSWAWKTTSRTGSTGDTGAWPWGMVTNSSTGGDMTSINLSLANINQIEGWLRQFANQPLVRNESIAYWMNWKPQVGQRVEAEMFSYHAGVRMETTADEGGGFNVSYTDDRDWMSYPIKIPASGSYTLQVRVASPYSGGSLALSRNATDLAIINVPNTGGWQQWTTVSTTVTLAAGQQDLVIYVRTGGWNMNWWQLTPL